MKKYLYKCFDCGKTYDKDEIESGLIYLCPTCGKVEKNQGTIESRIAEDRSLRMHSTNNATKGKPAITHFRVLRRRPRVTALEVTLETGRKNQIRVHLSEAGHPIVGDKSYGSKTNPLGRLGLHAFRLGFEHPITGQPLDFQTETPPEFKKYL